MSIFKLKKTDKLDERDLEILCALRTLSEYNMNFLSNEGHSAYNQLADKADELNLLW